MTAVLAPRPGAAERGGVSAPVADPSRWKRVWRGRGDDPAWVRPALLALLVGTGVLYIAGLGQSGWANSYYSAAVQAASQSWRAWFFGSFDSSNFITVDKSPASLWIMGLSARLFGVNAWSILVPQALEGVAAVGLLYAAIRRWFSPVAALTAGAVLALSPAAALMFRFNNPDALLVLCLVAGAYSLTRALESGSTKWLLLAFSCVGFGFLAKMLQALLVVPAFGLVYLFAGPPRFGKRVWQLALGAVAMVVSAGWWIAAVQLTPASARPYIGGSQNNSLWNLMFGYNGFGRLTGDETGSVGGGTRGGGRWGATGLFRLFNNEFGGQISWLLPAALILLAAGLLFTINAPRTDRTRAAFLLWGGWLLVTGVAFSLGQGIIHPYYTVALAPAIGALVGMGAVVLWQHRANVIARLFMVAAVLVTALWSTELLSQRVGLVSVAPTGDRHRRRRRHRRDPRVADCVEPCDVRARDRRGRGPARRSRRMGDRDRLRAALGCDPVDRAEDHGPHHRVPRRSAAAVAHPRAPDRTDRWSRQSHEPVPRFQRRARSGTAQSRRPDATIRARHGWRDDRATPRARRLGWDTGRSARRELTE